jgi:ATP-binding cassette subfamily C protein LapB
VKAAKEGLDSIMQLPTENQREETPIRQDVLRGHYLFEQAQFRYHRKIRAWRCALTDWRSTGRESGDPRAQRRGQIDPAAGDGGRYGSGGGELRLDNLSLPHLDVADCGATSAL